MLIVSRKKDKQSIISKIANLDEDNETRDLTCSEWGERYEREKTLNQILTDEEIQWQRRGGEMVTGR